MSYVFNQSFYRIIIASSTPSSSPYWRVNTIPHHIVLLFFEEPLSFFKFLYVGPFLLFAHTIISFRSDPNNVWSPHVGVLLLYFNTFACHEDIICIPWLFHHMWYFIIIFSSRLHLLWHSLIFALSALRIGQRCNNVWDDWISNSNILFGQISIKVWILLIVFGKIFSTSLTKGCKLTDKLVRYALDLDRGVSTSKERGSLYQLFLLNIHIFIIYKNKQVHFVLNSQSYFLCSSHCFQCFPQYSIINNDLL